MTNYPSPAGKEQRVGGLCWVVAWEGAAHELRNLSPHSYQLSEQAVRGPRTQVTGTKFRHHSLTQSLYSQYTPLPVPLRVSKSLLLRDFAVPTRALRRRVSFTQRWNLVALSSANIIW